MADLQSGMEILYSIHFKAYVKLIGGWKSENACCLEVKKGHAGNLSFDLCAFALNRGLFLFQGWIPNTGCCDQIHVSIKWIDHIQCVNTTDLKISKLPILKCSGCEWSTCELVFFRFFTDTMSRLLQKCINSCFWDSILRGDDYMFLGIIIFDLGTLSVERAHSIYSVSKRVLSCFELWQEAIIHRGQGVFCDRSGLVLV